MMVNWGISIDVVVLGLFYQDSIDICVWIFRNSKHIRSNKKKKKNQMVILIYHYQNFDMIYYVINFYVVSLHLVYLNQ